MKQKIRVLTGKQKLFVKHLIDNPKATATDAYKVAYNTINMKQATINREATRTTSLPHVQIELAKHNGLMESTLVNTVKKYKDSEKIPERTLAVDVAKYVHDKVHGKATQRVEQHSTTVNINLDLTGV